MLRSAVSQTAFGASLAVGLAFAGASPAGAQPASPADSGPATPVGAAPTTTGNADQTSPLRLPLIGIEGATPGNTLQGETGLGRLPGRIQSLPQSIAVVPAEVIRQQNVTSLESALRNVPGITSSTGEGNGGVQGDQLRIRGFNGQNDIYTDGLRDFGTYSRDTFNVEEVQALLGPSAMTFGAGSVGGAVNMQTRAPRLGNSATLTATGGMGPFARATADINRQIGETAAMRVVVMGQQRSNTPGLDGMDGNRQGVSASLGLGLGTDTSFTLEYMHYRYDEAASGGIPVVTPTGRSVGAPLTEFGLRRGTFLGLENDRDESTVDRLTARLQHRATDWLTLYNDTRLGFQQRSFSAGFPNCTVACANDFIARRPNAGVSSWGGGSSPFDQETWGIQNVTTAVARFNTGSLRHEFTVGVDAWFENTERTPYSFVGGRPLQSFTDPDNSRSLGVTRNAAGQRSTDTTQVGVFASDRVWLTPEFSILAGLRWTRFDIDHQQTVAGAPASRSQAEHSFIDPRLAVVWEPAPNQTYYASYAQSTTPPGSNFTTIPASVGSFNPIIDPERNTIYEIGARYGILNNRVGLSAALYRIDKDNAQDVDPLTGSVVRSGDAQRNQGIELGVSGRITDAWQVNARYAYIDSEVVSSGTAGATGKRVPYVPTHSAALWSTYEFNHGQSSNLTVGGGVFYRSQVYLNNTNDTQVPEHFSFDAMVSHRVNENVTVAVNGYNLTDNLNYDTLSTRARVGAGRTVLMTLTASF